MNPVHFEGVNGIFRVHDLQVPVRTTPGLIESAWKPTPEEIERIVAGATVHIFVKGPHPPQIVQV